MDEVDTIAKQIRQLLDDTYQRGWNDAVASIVKAAHHGVARPQPERGPVPEPMMAPDRSITEPKRRSKPAVQVILDVITEMPGLRGAEVFREAVNRIPGSNFKTMDRTGRTALRRLKERNKIHQQDDKLWYPGPKPLPPAQPEMPFAVSNRFVDIDKEPEAENN